MNLIAKYISFLLIALMIVSCKGQNKNQYVLTPESSVEKIENPKYGFYDGLQDNEGNLWFASNGGGVYKFTGKTFKNYTQKDGLGSNQVFSISLDNNQNLWFGTAKGLTRYYKNTFNNISLPYQDTSTVWLDKVYPVINPNAVQTLIQDKKGIYWIGTVGGGGYSYDGKKFTSILAEQGAMYEDNLYHNWISDIKEDKQGNIWFASMSYGGLTRFDGKTYKHFFKQDGLSDDMIREILVDKKGNLWLGFNGNRKSALTVYKEQKFYSYPFSEHACHRNIRALFEDEQGNIWIGGQDGVCVFSEGNFKKFTKSDGAPFSSINFIFGDSAQNIWFGGPKGIYKFDGEEVSKFTN